MQPVTLALLLVSSAAAAPTAAESTTAAARAEGSLARRDAATKLTHVVHLEQAAREGADDHEEG